MRIFKALLTFAVMCFSSPSWSQAVTNIPCNQLPALTGDITSTVGTCATTNTASAAWTAFTPSPSCGTATFTVNSARRNTMGKTTFAQVDITITAIGTCTNILTFTLPNTANSSGSLTGPEIGVANNFVGCRFPAASTAVTCLLQGGAAWAVNDHFIMSGVYENQ
jgi:hypothetical protein